MSDASRLTIRRAGHGDVSAIADLAAAAELASSPDSPSGGFLVSGFSAEDYSRFLDTNALLFLAEDDGLPVAFLLAWELYRQRETSTVEIAMRTASPRAIVIKQVAVASAFRGNGIGRHLYGELQNTAQDRPLVAAIVGEPRNIASEKFHESLGFHLIRNVTAEDGIDRSIWLRDGSVK